MSILELYVHALVECAFDYATLRVEPCDVDEGETSAVDLIQIIPILLLTLQLDLYHPTVALITRTVFDLFGYDERLATPFLSFAARLGLTGSFWHRFRRLTQSKERRWTSSLKAVYKAYYRTTEFGMSLCKARNATMAMPGDTNGGKTYSAWVQMAEEAYADVVENMRDRKPLTTTNGVGESG
ncbi:hypothetical protein LTR85_006492 [Meristemomyces frigidus]|nr:hypothetical protein LTR85_006492 [Meristemomyces frigidus]